MDTSEYFLNTHVYGYMMVSKVCSAYPHAVPHKVCYLSIVVILDLISIWF